MAAAGWGAEEKVGVMEDIRTKGASAEDGMAFSASGSATVAAMGAATCWASIKLR
jgi:hypothetical protein